MTVYRHPDKHMAICNSIGSDLAKQNQPIIHNQSLGTTTPSQSKTYPQLEEKKKFVQNHAFQHATSSQNKMTQNWCLEDDHNLPKRKF